MNSNKKTVICDSNEWWSCGWYVTTMVWFWSNSPNIQLFFFLKRSKFWYPAPRSSCDLPDASASKWLKQLWRHLEQEPWTLPIHSRSTSIFTCTSIKCSLNPVLCAVCTSFEPSVEILLIQPLSTRSSVQDHCATVLLENPRWLFKELTYCTCVRCNTNKTIADDTKDH